MAEVTLAANNSDLGGGEQMVIRTASALLALGHTVTVVAPDSPRDVLDAAGAIGAGTVAIRADSRRDYLRRLRTWDRRERAGLLWCHGLVPALATAGRGDRIVHLHQLPRNKAQAAALALARHGAGRVLTPSDFLSEQTRGAETFPNWTDELARLSPRATRERSRIGFLGRLSTDKGLDVLASALTSPELAGRADLVVAGDARWVPATQHARVTQALDALGAAVHLVGRVTPDVLLAQVDLVVFPSRVAESFGLVAAEAMASGVPFVISDAGALPEVAGPGHPWVARAGDAEDLARVIGRALTASTEQVGHVTDSARARWEDQYSPAAGQQRVARLLEDLEVS